MAHEVYEFINQNQLRLKINRLVNLTKP